MNSLLKSYTVKVRLRIRRLCSMPSKQFPNTIVIAGATCVGKSDVALEFCRRVNQRSGRNVCEIVIADAVQVYKEVSIGCTKPSAEEQAAVPHHLVDYRHLNSSTPAMNAGDFVDDAMTAIRGIHQRGNTAVVVGGATMWLDWLLGGKPNAPKGDIETRAKAAALLRPFQERGGSATTRSRGRDGNARARDGSAMVREAKAAAWSEAVKLVSDVVSANDGGLMTPTVQAEQLQALQKLTANNYKYLSRTLEIAMTPAAVEHDDKDLPETGAGGDKRGDGGGLIDYVSHSEGVVSLACFFLSAPDRLPLYRRIDRRCLLMLKAGLLTEVTDLLLQERLVPSTAHGDTSTSASAAGTVAKSIGYRQAIDFLLAILPNPTSGEPDEELEWSNENVEQLQHFLLEFTAASRNYARYQLQYFRDDARFIWCQGLVGRFDHQHSSTSKDIRSVVRELIYWCEEHQRQQPQPQPLPLGIVRRQLDAGVLYHQLVQSLPSSVVNSTDVFTLNDFVSEWHERHPGLPTEAAEALRCMPTATLMDELAQVAHFQEQQRNARSRRGQAGSAGFGSSEGMVSNELGLSALSPALRAKEPSGKKSALRTYQSRYRDVRADIKKAASRILSGASEAAPANPARPTAKKILPNVEGTNDTLVLLEPLLLEISTCRRRLIDSKRFHRS